MNQESVKKWFHEVCDEALDECNKMNQPAISFGVGFALGVMSKHLIELEYEEKNGRKECIMPTLRADSGNIAQPI